MFNSIFGQTIPINPTPTQLANSPHSQASMAVGQAAQAQNLNMQGLLGHAQNQYNSAYNQLAGQGTWQHLAAQQHMSQQQILKRYAPKQFRINGEEMDLDEFVNAIYPEDCAEKTFLILKLTKGNSND